MIIFIVCFVLIFIVCFFIFDFYMLCCVGANFSFHKEKAKPIEAQGEIVRYKETNEHAIML